MKHLVSLCLYAVLCSSATVEAQTAPVIPAPVPSTLLPDDPFTTITTRFSCAESQTLVITAKVPPKTLSVEFDDKRGIVASRSESGTVGFDALSATIASERITGRSASDYSNLRVNSGTTSVARELDSETQFWKKMEAKRRSENRDRLAVAENRNASGRKLTKDELSDQRDAYEGMLDTLERTQPITVKHKYKTYSLMLERSYTGPKFISRAQGVEWSVRNRLGTLRNTFSGRIIASNCRQGIASERAADLPAVTSAQ